MPDTASMNSLVAEETLLARIRKRPATFMSVWRVNSIFLVRASRYREVLARFYRFYLPWEERLERWVPNYVARQRN